MQRTCLSILPLSLSLSVPPSSQMASRSAHSLLNKLSSKLLQPHSIASFSFSTNAIAQAHPLGNLDFSNPSAQRSIHAARCYPASSVIHTLEGIAAHTRQQRSLLVQASREDVVVERLTGSDDGVIEVTLSRPQSKNAIGVDMLANFQQIFETIYKDSSARAMLLCSSVPGVFCAGADLKERRKMEAFEIKKFVDDLRAAYLLLEGLKIPTIAVIEGAALGGGLELALACDLRICGDNAIFGLPETSLAIIPGAGGTQRLPRVIGGPRAKELIFTARRIDGKAADSIGLVNHCVPSGDAYKKALDICREIMQQGPLAVKMAKIAIDRGTELDIASAVFVEENCYSKVLHSQDRIEGLAAFAEKRRPCYFGK